MSKAKNATIPDADGKYRVWCDPCDAEDRFPDIAMAIQARKLHLCEDEVPSAAWPGWALDDAGNADV